MLLVNEKYAKAHFIFVTDPSRVQFAERSLVSRAI